MVRLQTVYYIINEFMKLSPHILKQWLHITYIHKIPAIIWLNIRILTFTFLLIMQTLLTPKNTLIEFIGLYSIKSIRSFISNTQTLIIKYVNIFTSRLLLAQDATDINFQELVQQNRKLKFILYPRLSRPLSLNKDSSTPLYLSFNYFDCVNTNW